MISKPRTKRQKAYGRGVIAEYVACLYFLIKGYRPVKLRYKTPVGEIDLIARRGRTLVVAEVKSRADITATLEAVTPRNRKRIENAVKYFLGTHPKYNDYAVRFDVVGIAWPFYLKHLDNAWHAGT